MNGRSTVIERLYRLALRAYPREFRRRHEAAMLESLRDRLADPRYRGLGRVRLLGLLAEDTWRAAAEQRRRARALPGAAGGSGGWRQDLVYATRLLYRDPGTTVVAVLALALGIGLSTVAFAVVYGTVLRGLPFENASELVHFERADREEGIETLAVTPHDFAAWRAQQESFVDLAAYVEALFLFEGADGYTRQHWGLAISAHAFELLGVEPQLGRLFTPEEDRPGAREVVLIGHQIWQTRFGGDSDIVGTTVRINGLPTTVVGVMPPGFGFPLVEELWRPLRLDLAQHERGGGRLDAFGRLRAGATLDQARVDIGAISAGLAADFPETNAAIEPRLRGFVEEYVGEEFTSRVWTMLMAAVLVLALACLNVTSLLVARATSRASEVAVRAALGAGRLRIARQLLVETAMLAVVGGVLGVVVALAGVRLVARYWAGTAIFNLPHGPDAPSWWSFQIDPPVLAFSLGVTLLAVIVAGMAPLWHLRGADLQAVLKDQRAATSGSGRRRWNQVLVAGEMALCTALVVCAGLVVRSYGQLDQVGAGAELAGVHTAAVSLPGATQFDGSPARAPTERGYDELESRLQLWQQLDAELGRAAEVGGRSLATVLPASRASSTAFMLPETPAEADTPSARIGLVDERYFELLGVRPLVGRVFEDDAAATEPVAVVNTAFAERYFPDTVLNERIRLGDADSSAPWLRVVGVVPDLWMSGSSERNREGIYVPLNQAATNGVPTSLRAVRVLVSPRGPAHEADTALRRAVAALDDGAPVSAFEPLDAMARRGTDRYRVHGSFYLLLGAVSVLLAAVGLYGVLAQAVAQRRAEIGTRMALGADPGSVVRLVVRQALLQVGVGAAGGLLLASWLQPQIEQILFAVRPWDPVALVAVVGVLVVVAGIASLVPARRAARVDPLEAMRAE